MNEKEQGGYRIHDPHGTYFVTFTIVGWVDVFTRKECKDIVIDSFRYCQDKKGLVVNAYVIMSSHIHMVLRVDSNSDGLSNILRDMKKHIARQIIEWVENGGRESRKEWMLNVFEYHAKYTKNKSKYQVWQRGNQPKQCLHPKFTRQKLTYIHNNPVEAGIVDAAEEYRYSSSRNYTDREGVLMDVELIDFGVEEGGAPTSVTSIDGNTTGVTYDQFGRQESITTPAEYTITNDYTWDIRDGDGTDTDDASDAIYYTSVDHPAAPNSKTWYNSVGRARKTTTQDFKYGDGQYYENSVVQTYDLRGRIETLTNPFREGQSPLYSSYIYDEVNRPISMSSPSSTVTYSYDALSNGELTVDYVKVDEDNLTQTTTTDASGKTVRSTDTGGGTVEYEYYSHGKPKKVMTNGVEVSSMIYDEHARQTQLIEVNSGTTQYQYNAYGEIVYQKDSRAAIAATTLAYDNLGRVDYIDQHEGHIEYSYHESGNGINQISSIVNYNGLEEQFTYDLLDRLETHTEVINTETFVHTYGYNSLDQITGVSYPSGLNISYDYYAGTGFLKSVKDHQDNIIYEPLESNNYGQMTSYELGNQQTTIVTYDQYGILDDIHAGVLDGSQNFASDVFHMSFDFDIYSGLLHSRTDHKANAGAGITETFIYDSHYRLTTATVDSGTPLIMTYDDKGNILTKSDVSTDPYLYESDKIHAVTKIPKPQDIAVANQLITYNSAQQPLSISQGEKTLTYTYGADEQRRYAELSQGGTTQYERYYCGDYEQHIAGTSTHEVHYLNAGIIVVREDAGPYQYFYTYRDYLGSILSVTDDSGNTVAEQSFDAWGRRRNTDTWQLGPSNNYELPWLYRGYTGHEMLPELDLINMNGRLYDPIIGRMLSVDNYAGLDGTSQSYNRYSYVYNNPLMYTDPSGEIAWWEGTKGAFNISGKFAKAFATSALQFGGNTAVNALAGNFSPEGGGDNPWTGQSYGSNLHTWTNGNQQIVQYWDGKIWNEWYRDLRQTGTGNGLSVNESYRTSEWVDHLNMIIWEMLYPMLMLPMEVGLSPAQAYRAYKGAKGVNTTANVVKKFTNEGVVSFDDGMRIVAAEAKVAAKVGENFTIKKLSSFRGAKSADVMKWLERNGWKGVKTNPNRVYNDGMRFTNGIKGEQIRIMSGGATRSIPAKTGPYMEISMNGKKSVIELFGNPTLK